MASSGSSLEDIFSDPVQFEQMFGIPLSRFQESEDFDYEEEEEEALDDVEQLLSASGLQNDYLDLSTVEPPSQTTPDNTVQTVPLPMPLAAATQQTVPLVAPTQQTTPQQQSTLPSASLSPEVTGGGPSFENNWHDDNFHAVSVEPFREETGIAVDLPDNASALDLFSLYFPPETFERIAEETNRYAEWLQQQKGQLDINWKPTSAEEMKAFIGCNILMGINYLPALRMYWM